MPPVITDRIYLVQHLLQHLSVLMQLLTKDPSKRLGSAGAKEVQDHPLFKSIDWKRLEAGKMKPLFEPDVNIHLFSHCRVLAADWVCHIGTLTLCVEVVALSCIIVTWWSGPGGI